MSHIDNGPLASYNSLVDTHLTGFFANTRLRRHLQTAGLITKDGEIVSENMYRLNMSRKEHKKHVKDMLAQAIVHKTLDLERARQAEIRRTMEQIAKLQLVRRVRESRTRKRDEDVLPCLNSGSRLQSSLSPHAPKDLKQSRNRAFSAPARKGKRLLSGRSSNYEDSDEIVIYLDDEGRPISPSHMETAGSRYSSKESIDNKHLSSRDQIDTRNFASLDTVALRKYVALMAKMEQGQGGVSSPYLIPQVPLPPKSPRGVHNHIRCSHSRSSRSRSSRVVPKSSSPKRPSTALHPGGSAKLYQGQQETMCEVSMQYHGSSLSLAREQFDRRQDILIEQQHCGGNTLTVFKDKLEPNSNFTFVSYRHRGYPFSLSIYVDGQMDCRVSTCCEYRHKQGGRIGGKTGHFSIKKITGAVPCYKCQVEKGIKIQYQAPRPKLKRPSQNMEEVTVQQTAEHKSRPVKKRNPAEARDPKKQILVPVDNIEDNNGNDKYEDDFEASSKTNSSSSSSESDQENHDNSLKILKPKDAWDVSKTRESVDIKNRSQSSSSRPDSASESGKPSFSQKRRTDSSSSEEKLKGDYPGKKAQIVRHVEVPVDEDIPEPPDSRHGKDLIVMPTSADPRFEEKLRGSEIVKEQHELDKISRKLESTAKEDEDGFSRRTFSASSSSSSSVKSSSSSSITTGNYSDSEKEDDKKMIKLAADEPKDKPAKDSNKLETASVGIKPTEDKGNESSYENRRFKRNDVPISATGEAEDLEDIPSNVTREIEDTEDVHKVREETEERNETEEENETEEQKGNKGQEGIEEQKGNKEQEGTEEQNETKGQEGTEEQSVEKINEDPQEEKKDEISTEEEKKEEQKVQNERITPQPVVQDGISAEPIQRRDSEISSNSSSSDSSSSSSSSSLSYGSASINEPGPKELCNDSFSPVASDPIEDVHKDASVGLNNGQTAAAFDNDRTAVLDSRPDMAVFDSDLPAKVSDNDQVKDADEDKAAVFDIDALDNNSLRETVAGSSTAFDNKQTAAADNYPEPSDFGNSLVVPKEMKSLEEQPSTEASKGPISQVLTNTTADLSDEQMTGETRKGFHVMEESIAPLLERSKPNMKNDNGVSSMQTEEREFNKANSGIGDDDVGKVVESLKESPSNPVIVNFSHNPLTSASVKNILDLLRVKTSVQAISLQGTMLGDDGVIELVDGILELHNEKVKDELRKGPQELDLSDCKLGNKGAESIAKLIKSEIDLDTINLSSNNNVTSDGWKLIGNALADNKYLETLTLDHNRIGNEGIKHIAEGLQKNNSITTLDLKFVDVSEKGGECLMEMLKRNTSVIELNLDGNDISQELKDDIQKYIKLNKTMVDVGKNKGKILGAA